MVNNDSDLDAVVTNHGSIMLLEPISEHAKTWTSANIPDDAPMFGNAYAIEPRYIGAIVDGMSADGLVVG